METTPPVFRLPVSDQLDQPQDGAASARAGDLGEGLHEAERVPIGEQGAPVQIGPSVPAACTPVARPLVVVARAAIEQRGDRHAEGAGKLIEPAGADAVRAVFIFLDLLGSHPEVAAELGLREAALQTTDPDIASDQDIHAHRSFRHVISSPQVCPFRSPLADLLGDPPDEAAAYASKYAESRMIAGAGQDGQQTDVAAAPVARRNAGFALLFRDVGHLGTFPCVSEGTQVPIERFK
ncbi:MAG TPA: hypothetical protein VIW26_01665 [Gemmatimonadales bacterium]